MTDKTADRPSGDWKQGEALPGEPISIRIAAAVKLTGIGRSTLYEMIKAGDIETVKIGRSTFIRYASLKRLFERRCGGARKADRLAAPLPPERLIPPMIERFIASDSEFSKQRRRNG